MDERMVDQVRAAFAAMPHRRDTFRALLAAGIGAAASALARVDGSARKRRKKRKKRKKKPIAIVLNEFGCVDVGNACQTGSQCCSGICTGQKCQAHGAGSCQAGMIEQACGGEEVTCTTSAGEPGLCNTTTGHGPYCARDAGCFPCQKDADCVAACGPQAACILCAEPCIVEGGTACVGPSSDSCTF